MDTNVNLYINIHHEIRDIGKMSTYTMSRAPDDNWRKTTAYTSRLSNGNVIYCTGQSAYQGGHVQPASPPPDQYVQNPSLMTSRLPHFGENTASPQYAPPILTVIPFGGNLPQRIPESDTSPNSIAFVTSASPFKTMSKLWPLFDPTVSTKLGTHMLIVQNFLQNIGNSWSTSSMATGTHVYNGNPTISTIGDNSSTSQDTLVLINGNPTITDVITGTNNVTIVLAMGDITITNTPTPPTGGVIIIVTYKTLSISGITITTTSLQTNPIAAGTSYIVPDNVSPSKMSCVYSDSSSTGPSGPPVGPPPPIPNNLPNGTPLPDPGIIPVPPGEGGQPGSTSVYLTLPSFVSCMADMVMKIGIFDYACVDSLEAVLPPAAFFTMIVNNGGSLESTPSSAALRVVDLGLYGMYQFAVQFGFLVTEVSVLSQFGMACVKTVLDVDVYLSFLVIQRDKKSLPNAGVATASFYATPYVKMPMVQTYRVSEDGYVFCKGGYYITLSVAGEIIFNDDLTTLSGLSSQLEIPLLFGPGYLLDDSYGTPVSSQCTVAVTDVPQSSIGGGLDPYYMNSGVYQSKYRLLQKSDHMADVRFGSPYDSFVRYRPLGGRVVSAKNLISNVVVDTSDDEVLIQNTNRRSTVISVLCTVKISTGANAVLYPGINVRARDYLPVVQQVVYVDNNEVDFIGPNGQIYSVSNGDTSGVSPGYTVNHSSQTSDGAVSSVTRDVLVVVVFGDMVQNMDIMNFQESVQGPQFYLSRDLVSQKLVAWKRFPMVVHGSVMSFDATYCDKSERGPIAGCGFSISPYTSNEYTTANRVTNGNLSYQSEKLIIYGRVTLFYSTDHQLVYTGITGGTYTSNDPKKTVIVDQSGSVICDSFPFTVENVYYTLLSGSSTASISKRMSPSELNDLVTSGKINGFWLQFSTGHVIIDGNFNSQGSYVINSMHAVSGSTLLLTNGRTSYRITVR